MDPRQSDRSDGSGRAPRLPRPAKASTPAYQRLRPSGGYRTLRSFQATTLIYDATVSFCARFVDPRSRTVDQMVQAARSGRQNIAEGSRASATSSQTELRLVNVARASLDELLLDYEDFLRQRKMPLWAKDGLEARAVRNVSRALPDHAEPSDPTSQSDHARAYGLWLRHKDSSVVANAIICLLHQANFLLDQQIRALERDFIDEGGYSEQLAAARIAARRKQEIPTTAHAPDCPFCGNPMALRTARKGSSVGGQFWGCSSYPKCRGTRALDGDRPTR
jgi:restriction system protein